VNAPSPTDGPVFGVDIQSGDVRGDSPTYALVILRPDDGAEGEGAIERDAVSRRKLRRLIEDEEPTRLAVDNMYELAADKNALVGFLRTLPAGTDLVQVTGANRPEPLSRVAQRHGVPYGKKPMKEAEAAARLAHHNVGQRVTAFGDTTTVKVSRGRSTGGGGGWSEDRFTRRIHGNVRKAAREVESELDDAGLEYEKDATEKYGGLSNAIFTVEARPEDIPVSSTRNGDVRIEIERERRDGIEFEPLVKRRDHVIVGIDPGTTTAAAVVGIDGTVHDLYSSRTGDTAELTEWLIERGRPMIVAADVTPMPDTVEKFRRSFDAAGWVPDSDLPVDEKLHRTRDHDYENDHERDALAAALYAVDDHEDQFERIAAKVPPQFDREEVVARVVSGEESVEAVVRELTDDDGDDEDEDEHEERELTEEERRIRDLEAQVGRLKEHTEELEEELEAKENEIREYERELSDARKQERREARERREINRLERRAERLERERDEAIAENEELYDKLARLKTLWKLDHSNFSDVAGDRDLVAVKTIPQFTRDAVERADEEYGLASGDVIYLRDASGAGTSTAEALAGTEPRLVLKNGNLSDEADAVLFDHEIPVAPADPVTIQEVDELAVARESEVEEAIEDWEDRAEERRREQTESMMDRVISEHRADERLEDRGT
jgi:predicted RNase H-like nuclease (RuvC/YqgF family)